jgi:coatomer subunit beta'
LWRAELRNKNRPKIAASVAHPGENAELFEEGWEEALGREEEVRAARGMVDEVES